MGGFHQRREASTRIVEVSHRGGRAHRHSVSGSSRRFGCGADPVACCGSPAGGTFRRSLALRISSIVNNLPVGSSDFPTVPASHRVSVSSVIIPVCARLKSLYDTSRDRCHQIPRRAVLHCLPEREIVTCVVEHRQHPVRAQVFRCGLGQLGRTGGGVGRSSLGRSSSAQGALELP